MHKLPSEGAQCKLKVRYINECSNAVTDLCLVKGLFSQAKHVRSTAALVYTYYHVH